jgi:DNA-binding GntR family transcriptional regulator
MVRAFGAHGFGGKLALRSASVTIKVIGSSGDTVMPKAK